MEAGMGGTTHFPGLGWHRHVWRKRVTLAEDLPKQETNMWGRVVEGQYTHCIKHDVCELCGKTRDDISCLCDTDVGERCPIRRAWLDQERTAGGR
jgi:hypothetical protein